MIDWVAIWLAGKAAAFVFRPVLEELAKEASRDWIKDFCKGSLKSVFQGRDKWNKAIGKAVAEFLDQFEQELIGAGADEAACKAYTASLKQFVKHPAVRSAIGTVVRDPGAELDGASLEGLWAEQNLAALPADFRWRKLCRCWLKKVQSMLRELPDLYANLDSQNIQRMADTICGPTPADFDTCLQRYRETMIKRYTRLKLEELDPTTHDIEPLTLTRMFIPQTARECIEFVPQVFELPKEIQHRLRRLGDLEDVEFDEEALKEMRRAYADQSPQAILELAADVTLDRLVVLGDPGSGKSTLLQYLVLQWAADPNAHTPTFLIELREYARLRGDGKVDTFIEFLNHPGAFALQCDARVVEEQLQDRASTILFDGLDEVFDPKLRDDVTKAIHRFASEHPKARIIVTSRVVGYRHHVWRDEGFRHFMLQDLEPSQIGEFLERWHRLACADRTDGDTKRARLAQAIERSSAIAQLAGNPLLLTMMAILNRTQDLPRDRAELYEQCARLLLHQWKTESAFSDYPDLAKASLDFKDKRNLLIRVARAIQGRDANRGELVNLIDEATLEKTLAKGLEDIPNLRADRAARALISQLRVRNFMLCSVGSGSYAFVHRTFLEYFCASDIYLRFSQEQSLQLDELKTTVFDRHWADPTWHEVLCLLTGMLAPRFARKIIEFLLEREDTDKSCHHIFLAARCVGEVRRGGELSGVAQRVKELTESLIRFDLDYDYDPWDWEPTGRIRMTRVRAVQLLARIWSGATETVPWLKDRALNDDDGDVRRTAVQELARGWKEVPETLPWLKDKARNSENEHLRRTALQELARGWRDDPETLPLIRDKVRNDEDRHVRRTAVQELARGWRDDPETLPLIEDKVHNDEDRHVRRAAVQELARGWKDDPETLPWLRDTVLNDENTYVCITALQELVRGWKDDPETLPWLKDKACDNENRRVRRTALQELARRWKDDTETLSLIKGRARDDDHWLVRSTAVLELARGWKDDPETLPWLKGKACEDEDGSVRGVAVREVARGWKDDPETLPWLKDKISNSEDRTVRRTALQELAWEWKDDPETLPSLKDKISNSEDRTVRRTAVQAIAQAWKDDPETLPWLKNKARSDEDDTVQRTAVQELARGWKDDPETLPIIKDKARGDVHKSVCRTAVQELARGWKDDPETLHWLKDKACSNEDRHVRRTAVQELARGWKDDPETLPWLKNKACKDEDRHVRRTAVQELTRGWRDDPAVQAWLAQLKEHGCR